MYTSNNQDRSLPATDWGGHYPDRRKLGRVSVLALGIALLVTALAAPLAASLNWQVGWAPSALAAGTLIDDFTTCTQAVSAPPTSSDTAISCGISVLGGARTVAIERTGGGLPTNLFIYEDSGTGFAALANGPGVSSIATITWDADGVGLGSGAGVDISLEEGVNLTVNFSDLGVEVTVRLTDVDDNVSTSTKSFGQTLPPGAPFFFDFDNFTGSADLIEIKKIELVLVGGNASDTIITLIELEAPEVDFGDLPDGPNFPSFSYGTLLANNGPRHVIDTNLLLGKLQECADRCRT